MIIARKPWAPGGEPIELLRRVPVARWYDEEDGGWLDFDTKLTKYQPGVNLQVICKREGTEAYWVMGCSSILCDVVVGQA